MFRRTVKTLAKSAFERSHFLGTRATPQGAGLGSHIPSHSWLCSWEWKTAVPLGEGTTEHQPGHSPGFFFSPPCNMDLRPMERGGWILPCGWRASCSASASGRVSILSYSAGWFLLHLGGSQNTVDEAQPNPLPSLSVVSRSWVSEEATSVRRCPTRVGRARHPFSARFGNKTPGVY
jgi:hypothetical protein